MYQKVNKNERKIVIKKYIIIYKIENKNIILLRFIPSKLIKSYKQISKIKFPNKKN